MTGSLTLTGSPPLIMPSGAAAGYVLTTDGSGNVSPQPPQQFFSLLSYGGTGDGVTDNHSAYTAAVTAVNAAGGGILYIPEGRYYSSFPLLPGTNTTMLGDGIDKTVLLPSTTHTGGNGDGIRVVLTGTPYYSNITVRDLTIDCSATYPALANYGSLPSPASNGITMQGVDDLLIERVKIIKPTGYGVTVTSPGSGGAPYVKRPRIRDLYVEGERGGFDSLGGGGIHEGSIDGLYVHPAADGTNPYGTATDWTNMRQTTIRRVRAWTTFIFGMTATSTPAFPPSATNLVNPYAFPVTVTTSGGTITAVSVNDVSQTVSGTYTLPGFGTISVTYTGNPTWTWAVPTAPAVPASGTPATNPFPYPVPVNVTGGTVSAVAVNGVTSGSTSGYFVVPVSGTITLTYSVAPTWAWATTNAASGVATDFGAVDVLYDDLSLNGFKNGVLQSKPVSKPFPSRLTVRNSKFTNIAFDGVDTNVASGLGIAGMRIIDNEFHTYGMLGAAHGIHSNGTTGFVISGNKFGIYGITSFAIELSTDGVNPNDYGVITGNDMHTVGIWTIDTASGAGVGSNVVIANNPGFGVTLPIASGGTGQITAAAAFNALSPMTTLGDLEYESAAGTSSRLAGNITATKKFLTQTGTGSVSAAPGWGVLASTDVPAADIQFFTSVGSNTWTKPGGVTTVEVVLLGGGGGGGSGRQGAAGSVRCGGGGGAGGVLLRRVFAASDLTSPVTVTIGDGGGGGTAQTSASNDGNNGTTGVNTTFGSFATGQGGAPGNKGTALVGGGGATQTNGGNNGAGGTASTTGGTGGGSSGAWSATGGGAGGGITSGDSPSAGGTAAVAWTGSGTNNAAGGVVDSTSPGTGTQPAVQGSPSCGGGGGAGSITTTAQTGAQPFYGGGGGGGGASLNGSNSGAGGKGGPGFALVISR